MKSDELNNGYGSNRNGENVENVWWKATTAKNDDKKTIMPGRVRDRSGLNSNTPNNKYGK
jgi:hypothetical protein